MTYILYVEDNQAQADLVIRVLKTAGHEVKHTVRGLEGAKMARKERPKLILMDFDLPDIDGRTIVLTLKKQLGRRDAPPIIAVTGRSGTQEEYIARRMGCDGFIAKPFLPETLLNMITKMLSAKELPQNS